MFRTICVSETPVACFFWCFVPLQRSFEMVAVNLGLQSIECLKLPDHEALTVLNASLQLYSKLRLWWNLNYDCIQSFEFGRTINPIRSHFYSAASIFGAVITSTRRSRV